MATKKKSLLAAAGNAGEALAIEDVFSTYLYTGNGSTQTITNGIDLAGEGGLVWTKSRVSTLNHYLYDTERGVLKPLQSNNTDQEFTQANSLTSFNSDGFSLGASDPNQNTINYASWTFRKAPRFFDVVTYTGDDTAGRTISHNLGIKPGCVIVKCTSSAFDWAVWHQGVQDNDPDGALNLNSPVASTAYSGEYWSSTGSGNNTEPTDAVFTVSAAADVNRSGETYVAYLFAHDPLGPSEDGSDGLIACGSYTAAANVSVDLGWEPQWVLTKNADIGTGHWKIVDNMRGFVALPGTGPYSRGLYTNLSNAEGNTQIQVTPTGFAMNAGAEMGFSGTCIYIAIRRGPMRQPESGTEVFAVDNMDLSPSAPPAFYSGWPVDMYWRKTINTTNAMLARTRMIAGNLDLTSTAGATTVDMSPQFAYNTGADTNTNSLPNIYGWMWRRAPGFFDVVAYTGDGVAGRTVSHNLGVAPEMMIVKRRNSVKDWPVYLSAFGGGGYAILNSTTSYPTNGIPWNSTDPTDSVFTLGSNNITNGSGDTYIAYLFASLAGISKVGSYTGNGSSQTIDCGFTSGARFILIKRTDSTGDWYIWDTARGIVAANDPHLSLNTTAAEVTTDDSVDPDNSGFIVNQVAATNINVNAATYIFYAIA